jgi:hypothetical protein
MTWFAMQDFFLQPIRYFYYQHSIVFTRSRPALRQEHIDKLTTISLNSSKNLNVRRTSRWLRGATVRTALQGELAG